MADSRWISPRVWRCSDPAGLPQAWAGGTAGTTLPPAASQRLRATQRPGAAQGAGVPAGARAVVAQRPSPAWGLQLGPRPPPPRGGAPVAPQSRPPRRPSAPPPGPRQAHASGSLPLTIFAAAVAVTREGELAGAESAERPSHGRGTERRSQRATRSASLPGGGCAGSRFVPKRDCARHALPAVAMQPAGQAAPCPESRRRVPPHVLKTRGPGSPLTSSGLWGWGLPHLLGTRR